MRNFLSIALFVCTFAWCTNGWCEEKDLDPGVINDWIRSAVKSESEDSDIKRVLRSTMMADWMHGDRTYQVRYEVSNSDCKRTLAIFATDVHGESWFSDWVKLIEDNKQDESTQLERPRVFVKTYKSGAGVSPVMDLSLEYDVLDGLPVLVVSDQRDVIRTLREFTSGDSAKVRVNAFESQFSFQLNLRGFAEKVDWAHEQCPLDQKQEESKSDMAS